MLATLAICGRVWNEALYERKQRWEEQRLRTSYALQARTVTGKRRNDLQYQELYSQTAQDVLRRVDKAFKAFFEHRSGYPRFKRQLEFGSFTYPQASNGSVRLDTERRRLFLSRIGNIRSVFHRPIPGAAVLKTCTVVHEPCGEWYACLVFEDIVPLVGIGRPAEWSSLAPKSPLGVDLGLRALITTSDGNGISHPKFLKKAEHRLVRLQRNLSRKANGSRNRWKVRKRVATAHAKVSRQRKDFNHKLSNRLARHHDLIGFENLTIRNMVRNHTLAKSIFDAGWAELVTFTEYKAMETGGLVVKVDAARSTQECYSCATLNKVSLGVKAFTCTGCGEILGRDLNAARIVLKRALAKVGQGMPELKPVETRPLPIRPTEWASQVVEAGTLGERLSARGATYSERRS